MRPATISRLLAALATLAAAGPAQAAPNAAPTAKPAAPARAPAPAREVDLAFGAYQRGLYQTALREATARLERDRTDAAAMTLLGELYNQGLGVRQDPDEAARWYKLAAARNEPHAMASLGLMALDGRGIPKDRAAGRAWLERAAAAGEPSAAYNLALAVMTTGTEADLPRIAALLRVAADAEIGDAQHDLGVLYAQGRGVPRDTAKAAELYGRASRNGSLAGQVEYAIALVNGEGIAKDETVGARYFRMAALRGNAIAQNRLARLYATGRGVPRNLGEAASWNLVASGQGLSDAWLDGAVKDLPGPERERAEKLAAERAAAL